MRNAIDRRQLLGRGMAIASSGATLLHAPGLMAASSIEPRLPDVLSVDYTARDHEVVDYANYSLDDMPRILFRGPRFDPRAAAPGSFFTAFGSAHTLGTFSPVTYVDLLARDIDLAGWNVGVGGAAASFYNTHSAIIDHANRGKFAIVQFMSARMESNDRIATSPAAGLVLDRKQGDVIAPEVVWARIEKEEPEKLAAYVAQSRASWAAEHRKLLAALKVPVILFWFSARDIHEGGRNTTQVGSLATTSFPQFVNADDVAKVKRANMPLVQCASSRGADYPLLSRFTGQPVRVNHRNLGSGRAPDRDMFDDRNSYYPSPEMHEDAAKSLQAAARRMIA